MMKNAVMRVRVAIAVMINVDMIGMWDDMVYGDVGVVIYINVGVVIIQINVGVGLMMSHGDVGMRNHAVMVINVRIHRVVIHTNVRNNIVVGNNVLLVVVMIDRGVCPVMTRHGKNIWHQGGRHDVGMIVRISNVLGLMVRYFEGMSLLGPGVWVYGCMTQMDGEEIGVLVN